MNNYIDPFPTLDPAIKDAWNDFIKRHKDDEDFPYKSELKDNGDFESRLADTIDNTREFLEEENDPKKESNPIPYFYKTKNKRKKVLKTYDDSKRSRASVTKNGHLRQTRYRKRG